MVKAYIGQSGQRPKRNQKQKRRTVFQQIGNINKDIEFINKNQIEIMELKSTLTEIFEVY